MTSISETLHSIINMLLEGVEENGKLEDEEGDDRSIESTNE
jgi:hypothetical protein